MQKKQQVRQGHDSSGGILFTAQFRSEKRDTFEKTNRNFPATCCKWNTPCKTDVLNPTSCRLGSDDFPDFNWNWVAG